MPRVTVVTAAYNASPYLGETIESARAQTFPDFEHVIVDDGSTDDTASVAERYIGDVTLVRQPNAGAGAARNRGIEGTDSEFVAILDADDVWAPDKLERQVAALDRNPDAGLCYTNATSVRTDGSTVRALMVPSHPPLTCLTAMTGGHHVVTSSVVVRRRFLEQHPYRADLPGTEDYHVNLKVLWRSGDQSLFIDESLVRYRVVDTSVLRQLDAWERGRLTLRAVEAFIDDMDAERPLPQSLQRRGIAYAHFQWAWYCVAARVRPGFALAELGRAVRGDPSLWWPCSRQVAKMALVGAGVVGRRTRG